MSEQTTIEPGQTKPIASEATQAEASKPQPTIQPPAGPLSPADVRRLRPSFLDVPVPSLGTLRLHRIGFQRMLEFQAALDEVRSDDEVEVADVVPHIRSIICASLGGEWDTEDGLEAISAIGEHELYMLSSIVNGLGGIGDPVPVGVNPWKWAEEKSRNKRKSAVETAKNE